MALPPDDLPYPKEILELFLNASRRAGYSYLLRNLCAPPAAPSRKGEVFRREGNVIYAQFSDPDVIFWKRRT